MSLFTNIKNNPFAIGNYELGGMCKQTRPSPNTKTRDMAQFIDGLARAPKAVNDGNGSIFVSQTGEVSPSGFLPLVVGNVKENRLRDIYTREIALNHFACGLVLFCLDEPSSGK